MVGLISLLLVLIISFQQNWINYPFASSIPSECSTTQILDIDEIDVSYGEGFNERIHITARPGGGGECATIAWTKEELEDALNSKGDGETEEYSATKDLPQMYLQLKEMERRYSINEKTSQDYKDIYGFRMKKYDPSFLEYCTIDNCEDEFGTGLNFVHSAAGWEDCGCVYREKRASKGDWSSQSRDYREVLFGITGEGEETISGEGQLGSISLGEKVTVEWRGDFFTGIGYESPDEYKPVKNLNDRNWYFLNDYAVSNWDDTYDRQLEVIEDCGRDLDCIETAIVNANNRFEDMPKRQDFDIDDYLDKNEGVKGIKIEEDYSEKLKTEDVMLKMNFEEAPSLPAFDIYIDAEWAGISKFITEPRCEFVQDSMQVDAGNQKSLSVDFYNDAEYPGSMTAELNCDSSGISGYVSPTNYPFDGKGRKEGKAVIGGTAPGQDVHGSCEIEVKDDNEPQNSDTCSIDVQVKSIECNNPGESWCNADYTKLLRCNNERNIEEETCEYGCNPISESTAECASEPPPECPDTCEADSDCDPCSENSDDDYICFKEECRVSGPGMECSNCFSWFGDKLGTNKCQSKSLVDKWYIPSGVGETFSQDNICPILLGFIALVGVGFIIIIVLVIKQSGGGSGYSPSTPRMRLPQVRTMRLPQVRTPNFNIRRRY